jgi:cell division protein FtsW (lipid II flippase)
MRGKTCTPGIDLKVQELGERLLKNKKGSIVALDPKTGEVIALVSSPAYDPELLVGRVRSKNYRALQQDSLNPLFDRALQAQYPPGSIFKLVQSAIALQEGVITLNTGFPCNKALVGCHNHPNARTIQEAVQMSCNPYFYQVFKREIEQGKDPDRFKDAALGLAEWKTFMQSFGLGSPPLLDLPALKGGSIPGVAYYNKMYGEFGWAFSTIYSLSIGQGEVLVAPMQMANIAAIFANRGYYFDPHVVRAIGSPDSLKSGVQRHHTLVDDEWFPPIVEGMRRVVNEPGGTARQGTHSGYHRVRQNRDRTKPARKGPRRIHRLRAHGRSQDRDRRVRGELRCRRNLGRSHREPLHGAIPYRQYFTAGDGEGNGRDQPHRHGRQLQEIREQAPQTMNRRENVVRNIDWPLVVIYLLLMAMGWANIYSAAYDPAHANLFDRAREYGAQSVWICASLLLGASMLLVRGDFIRDLSYPIYGGVLLLLVLVLLVGREVNGAKAWFGVGGFGIQPAEFSKFATSLALTKYLSGLKTLKEMRSRVIAAALILAPVALIMLQPDTGTALVSGAFVLVLYREGISGNILLLAILAAILTVLSLLMKENTYGIPFSDVELHGQYFLIFILLVFAVAAFLFVKKFILIQHRKRIYGYLLFGLLGSAAFIATVDQAVDRMPMHQQTRIRVLLGPGIRSARLRLQRGAKQNGDRQRRLRGERLPAGHLHQVQVRAHAKHRLSFSAPWARNGASSAPPWWFCFSRR